MGRGGPHPERRGHNLMSATNSETVNILTRMLHDEWEENGRLKREIERSKIELESVMDLVQELKDERAMAEGRLSIELQDKTDDLAYQVTRNDNLFARNSTLQDKVYALEADLATARAEASRPGGDTYKEMALRMFAQTLLPKIVEEHPSFLDMTDDVLGGRYKNKIPFIKEVREESGLGLLESKKLVDEYLDHQDFVRSFVEDIQKGAITFEPEDHDFESSI
jgi:hypothetical protein